GAATRGAAHADPVRAGPDQPRPVRSAEQALAAARHAAAAVAAKSALTFRPHLTHRRCATQMPADGAASETGLARSVREISACGADSRATGCHCCWPHPASSPASGCGTWINHPPQLAVTEAAAAAPARLLELRASLIVETACGRVFEMPADAAAPPMDSRAAACDAVGWSCSQQLLAEQVCRLASLSVRRLEQRCSAMLETCPSVALLTQASPPAALSCRNLLTPLSRMPELTDLRLRVPELVRSATDLAAARRRARLRCLRPIDSRFVDAASLRSFRLKSSSQGLRAGLPMPAPSCEPCRRHADWSCRAGVGTTCCAAAETCGGLAAGGTPATCDQLPPDGALLARCPGLAFLTLDLCTDDLLPALLSRLPRLHCLRLTDCSRLTHQAWANLRELQSLGAATPDLHELRAHSRRSLTDEALADLCASPVARGLRRLSLSFDCSQLTAASLASIASGCPLLTRLVLGGSALRAGRPAGFSARRSSKLCLISCFELAETGEQLHHCSRTMAEACASQSVRPAPKSLRLEAAEAAGSSPILKPKLLLSRLLIHKNCASCCVGCPACRELTMNQKFSDSLAAVLADGCGGRLHSRAAVRWTPRAAALVVSRLSQGLQELELKDALCDGLDRALPLSLRLLQPGGHPCSKNYRAADRPECLLGPPFCNPRPAAQLTVLAFGGCTRTSCCRLLLSRLPRLRRLQLYDCGRLTPPGLGRTCETFRSLGLAAMPTRTSSGPSAAGSPCSRREAGGRPVRQSGSPGACGGSACQNADRLTAASVGQQSPEAAVAAQPGSLRLRLHRQRRAPRAAFGQRGEPQRLVEVGDRQLWRRTATQGQSLNGHASKYTDYVTPPMADALDLLDGRPDRVGPRPLRKAIGRQRTRSGACRRRQERFKKTIHRPASPLNPDADRIIAGSPLNPDA
uniref:F-box domain-containing protein n=1 Tax=Macrostomum lignano TaxID=282301 RepID=A0A1I8JS30_9PLAT